MTLATQPAKPAVGAVVIGRNEGDRLLRCIESLADAFSQVVYVDSGSTDASIEVARSAGLDVVELSRDRPYTAARARNAGFERLLASGDAPDFIQFIDGDCELAQGWLERSVSFIEADAQIAVVCGRRRERFPQASVWNRLIDAEWNTPVGEALSCGGDALMRVIAFQRVGGFNEALIAGEEPELCYRLRHAGWKIHRMDVEMTIHDAAMTRFAQWWKRSRRTGHTYAEGAVLLGRGPERYNVQKERRALIWGAAIPAAATFGTLISPWMLALVLAWPAQILRLMFRGYPWEQAVFLTLGKVPEAVGAISFRLSRITNRTVSLIEYK